MTEAPLERSQSTSVLSVTELLANLGSGVLDMALAVFASVLPFTAVS
jgi:hypothetical protein